MEGVDGVSETGRLQGGTRGDARSYLDRAGILATRGLEELLDLRDLAGLKGIRGGYGDGLA